MSDNKLPTRYNKPATVPSRVDRTHAPARDQSLFGKFVSGFMARLHTQTVQRNTEEVEALAAYRKEEGKLADATLERDRKIEHYLQHRDDIIADDHEQHRDQMKKNQDARIDAREEREHQRKLVRQQRERELNQATFAAATTRFGLEVYQQTRPHRLDELEQRAKEGTYDAELDMLISFNEASKERTSENAPKAAPPQTDVLKKAIAEVTDDIKRAQETGASDEVIAALYGTRARLSVLMEKEKNQSC